jgi:hypothetical protein
MQLTIKSLSKTYANGVCALSDVSLMVRSGLFSLKEYTTGGHSLINGQVHIMEVKGYRMIIAK